MRYKFSATVTINAKSLREAREKMDELEDCHKIEWTILYGKSSSEKAKGLDNVREKCENTV